MQRNGSLLGLAAPAQWLTLASLQSGPGAKQIPGSVLFFFLNSPARKLKKVKVTHGRMQAPELVPDGSLLHGNSSADLQTSGEKRPEKPQTAGQPARAEGRCCTSQFLPASWGPHYEGRMELDSHVLS